MAFKNFNYLDHFQDVEMDLTKYLEKFSAPGIALEFRNIQPVKATVTNLFEQSNLIKTFKDDGSSYTVETIQDGELPEDVALRFYGSEDFWWIVTLFNDIDDPLTDWPITDEQLNYLADQFIVKENKYSRKAYYNIMFEINEGKRSVDILRQDNLIKLIQLYKQQIKTDTKPTTNQFTIRL